MKVIFLPVTFLFIFNACAHLYYALNLKKKFSDHHNLINSGLTIFLWIFAAISYPIYINIDSFQNPLFLSLSVFFICIFTPLIIFLILLYQYLFVIKKNPNIKKNRTIQLFLNRFDDKKDKIDNIDSYTLKIDIYRKLLHLFPAFMIIALWCFAVYIWDGIWNADLIWEISGEEFGKLLIITVGYSGILVFAALDYVRLSYIFPKKNLFHFLPDNVLDVLTKSLKKREIFEFTKPAALVLAFVPIFFFPFGIFSSAALISTIGDGAASIFGCKFGKRHFPKSSQKTLIGYIAGTTASFIVSFLSLLVFQWDLYLVEIMILSIISCLTFFVIDIANLNIDDNILNPIFCGSTMLLVYLLFN